MQWENVHIFISSTFNDMHAERDYLVKRVFPQLSVWCEERKLRLIDIDLRWGVSEADATQNKRVVQVCLDRIDACRPFFLCFLGQRRGWIPEKDDINPNTYEVFPKLVEKYVGNTSVTEMEILHALIDPLHHVQSSEYAFFYLREPDYLESIQNERLLDVYTNRTEQDANDADKQLAKWRQEIIPSTGRPVYKYTAKWNKRQNTPEISLPLYCPSTASADSETWNTAYTKWAKAWRSAGVEVCQNGEIIDPAELQKAKEYNKRLTQGRLSDFKVDRTELADVIIEDMKQAIIARFGERAHETDTPLQRDIDQQAQFLQIAGEGFIERQGDFDLINKYLSGNDSRPFALTAFAGMGKTSLLAHFISTYRPKDNEVLHYRFIGGSDNSVNVEQLIRSLLNELKESGKMISDIPTETEEMLNQLPDILDKAGKEGKIILIIDALNQLETGMENLSWIPTTLPKNVKLIVSFKRGDKQADIFYHQQVKTHSMILQGIQPFNNTNDRKKLITAYLNRYFKELDNARIECLINSEGSNNPLFLKVVLSELRVFGVHHDLTAMIHENFGNTPEQAFEAMLLRIESDPAYSKISPAISLPYILGWLAHSRYGLTTQELSGLLIKEGLTDNENDANDTIYLILRQLRPYFAKRDGRIDFFFDSFKIAATVRYTTSHHDARTSAEWHRSLAAYFELKPLSDKHKLMEQAWQYINGDLKNEYIALMTDCHFLYARIQAFDIYSLLNDLAMYQQVQDMDQSKDIFLIRKMHDALKMSTFILEKDKTQIFSHLFGRLNNNAYFLTSILCKTMKSDPPIPWFMAETKDTFKYPDNNLIRSFKGYNKIQSVLLCKKGKSIALLLKDKDNNEIEIRDVETGSSKKRIHCNAHKIFLTNQGSNLMALCRDNILDTYSMETGILISKVKLMGERMISNMGKAILSNDEKMLYIDNRYTVLAFDVSTGHLIDTVHCNDTKNMEMAVNGSMLLIHTADRLISYLIHEKETSYIRFSGPKEGVNLIAISPNGGYTAICHTLNSISYEITKAVNKASPDLDVYVYKTGENMPVTKLKQNKYNQHLDVIKLAFINETQVLVLDATAVISLWDITHTVIVRKIKCTEGYSTFFVVKDMKNIIAARCNGQLDIINYESGVISISLKGHSTYIRTIHDSIREKYLVSCSSDNMVNIWDLSRENSWDYCKIINGPVSSIYLYKGGEKVLCAGGSVVTISTKNINEIKKINQNTNQLKDYIINDDEKWLIGYSEDSSFIRFGNLTNLIETPIDWHEKNIKAISANKDRNLLLSVDKGGGVILWSTKSKSILLKLTVEGPKDGYEAHTIITCSKENTPPISGAALSDEGHVAVLILHDGRIAIWDLSKVKNKRIPTALTGFYNMMSLLSEGKAKRSFFIAKNINISEMNNFQQFREFYFDKQKEWIHQLNTISTQKNIPMQEVVNAFLKAMEKTLPVAFSDDGKQFCYIQDGDLIYSNLKDQKSAEFKDEVEIKTMKFLNDDRIVVGNSLGKVYVLNFINP
ncbi:MAG TPA: hypothetical protein DEQ30_08505 [Porphyromonadaceae bacterium]|nr:hypothetical protein [Porphyromonadaceae bacterium]